MEQPVREGAGSSKPPRACVIWNRPRYASVLELTKRILAVTGATGFIGSHLIPVLLEKGYSVRSLVRQPRAYSFSGVEVRRADLLEKSTLEEALEGVDTAFYLVHSMHQGKDFAELDKRAALNFVCAAESIGVRRIIYLGGLGEIGPSLSKHLKSRTEVAEILQSRSVKTTVLRAAIILGPGGLSWDMLRQLVQRLPLMVTPRWVETKCQPIALRDVLGYLEGCAVVESTVGRAFDIGGQDILTYREMMQQLASVMNKRLWIFGIPFLTPRLSSYWVDFVTDVPSNVAHPLIEGLKNEVVCKEQEIRLLVPLKLTPYKEAVTLALQGIV
jgi:uncharacterized protein YbjT (DUF2867 family)